MRNEEVNTGLGGCELCGKRLPARNNQVNLECRKEGLCRECYEAEYRVCKESGCGNDLPKGRRLKDIAARTMGYCLYHYEAKFPERKPLPGIVIEGDGPDYDEYDPYGWIDQFHGDWR